MDHLLQCLAWVLVDLLFLVLGGLLALLALLAWGLVWGLALALVDRRPRRKGP